MSQISVISKLTGVETTTEGTQITLDHSSIVKLNVDRANIADYSRSGNDLVITLNSGEVITLKNFYVTDAQGVSQLVLEESDGALWWIEDPTGAATYESIASTDALLAASGSDAGGAAAWPWVLGGLAAAGGIAIAAGTGGGGGGDDDNNNPNPGNPGNPSEPDTTPPNAPTNLQVSPDGKTVTGTAEPGSTITLKDADGNTIGTGKVGSDGKFTIDLGTPLTNGEQITATATDPSGNTSQGGQVTAPDLTAPDAPANLEVSPDGKTVSGTAEPGSTVTLKDADGNTIGTGKAGSDGKFTIDLGTPLTNGEQITATATDPSGNTSPGVQVTAPDSTAPAAPEIVTVNDNVGTEAGPLSNGQRTDDARPTFSGISEAGTVITFYDNGKPIGTATADATGKWSFTPSTNLSEGNHAITTTATDAAGNQSGLSQPINFTVDLTPPDMPEATLNSTGTQITGTAEPGSKIVITNNAGVQIGTATADSNGNYVADLNPAQVNGEIISVVASDAAGNQSSPALVNAADITAPAAPGNLVVAEDGASVSGTAEPNSTIIIKAPDGTIIGQATAGPDGTFTIPISPAQTNGEALAVTATDGSGNTSPSGFADAPDSTPPLAPENVVISADGTTVTGTAEPGSTVTIRENGVKVGEAVADDQGNFSVDLIPPKANGEALTADATDTAGNTGPTAPFDAPDITAAQTPVITGVEDDALDVTGPVSQNGLTNDKTPTINGTGEPGTTITLYSGTTEIGTAVVGPDGQWSITLETDLPDGGHVLTATAVDANNNLSGTSNTWSITVDTAAPGAPAITQVIDDVPGRTGPLDNNQITNDTLPTLNGTGEPGSTVTIRLDGQDIGTAIVNNGGAWTFTPTTALGNGQHTFTVVASDAAGNTSASSPGFTFTVDTTPPPAATLDTVSDNIGTVQVPLNSGDTTDDTLPQLQGTAPEGTTITIYDGTTLLGTAVLDGSGGWSFTPTTPLTDGPHSLTVHATDEAGNTTISPPFELAIDTTAPATPDIPEITVNPDGATPGTALNPGETTRDTTPTLSGSGTPGDTVNIYDGATKIGEAEIDGDGNWSWTPEDPLPDGTYDLSLTVTNQDSAGNESAPSTPVTITIDTDAPGQPGIPTVTDSVSQITGPVDNGGTTNDPRPVLSGTGTPNDVITIYDQVGTGEPQAVGSVTVDGSGNWSWRPESNIGEGTHQYTATATDEAGNESLPSTGITITVDTLAPDTPLIGSIGGAQNGGSTNDNTPVIGGGGTTGETVIIYNNGVEVDRVEIANGEWSYTLPTQTDGPLNITVAAVDDAGNLSPVSPVFSVTVDTQAPTVPQIDAVSDSQRGLRANGTKTYAKKLIHCLN
ncbi:putative outer membrane adhesin like protein [Enterobacter hormaechei]|nr:Ig-like domain-containing protein [Enterobacter hormaechei]VAF70587.1 putative outer membrane adhesin like protein [Enterobacter hormaechei]